MGVLVVGCEVVIHDLRVPSNGDGTLCTKMPSPHRKSVVAMGRQGKYALTLSMDAVLKIWDTEKRICVGDVVVEGAEFVFGYPYAVAAYGSRAICSADQGVFLVELPVDTAAEPGR